jgi:hypothetical protein
MTSVTVNADLTVHVVSFDGTKEFFLPSYNPETMVGFANGGDAHACALDFAKRINCWVPFKTAEQREQERHDQAVAEANAHRDALFAQTVDRINPLWWASMTEEQQAEATAFRADCLTIGEQEGYPHDIAWPAKPSVFEV